MPRGLGHTVSLAQGLLGAQRDKLCISDVTHFGPFLGMVTPWG